MVANSRKMPVPYVVDAKEEEEKNSMPGNIRNGMEITNKANL